MADAEVPPLVPKVLRLGAFGVAYHDAGAGPPILFVHGLGSSRLAWARVLGPLAVDHRVIAPDLPGFGDSDKPRYRYTIPFYAARLVRLLDELGIESCAWVGHSMGAQIALWAALHHPERVRALALVAPAGIETFSEQERRALEATVTPAWVRRQTPRQIRDALSLAFHRVPAEAELLLRRRLRMRGPELEGYAHAFAQGVRAMLEAPVHDRLAEVRQRALVLFGDNDRLVPNRLFRPHHSPRALAQEAGRRLGAEVALLPRTGHLLAFEDPAGFVRELRRFLANAAPHNNDVAAHKRLG